MNNKIFRLISPDDLDQWIDDNYYDLDHDVRDIILSMQYYAMFIGKFIDEDPEVRGRYERFCINQIRH